MSLCLLPSLTDVINLISVRYRLAVLGTDPSDYNRETSGVDKAEPKGVEFVFFGELGDGLVGMSASTLVMRSSSSHESVPPEIARLYGRTYTLRVNVPRTALQRKKNIFPC